MKRHYALISVQGITEEQFKKYLATFIQKMDDETGSEFGCIVSGLEEEYGREIEQGR